MVRAFADTKDNFDSGQFKAIQMASAYALQHPEITDEIADKYNRRLAMLADALSVLGFEAKKPAASFFLYVRAPRGVAGGQRFDTGEDFSQFLIREKLICAVPWDDAGPYIRFSVTFQAGFAGGREGHRARDRARACRTCRSSSSAWRRFTASCWARGTMPRFGGVQAAFDGLRAAIQGPDLQSTETWTCQVETGVNEEPWGFPATIQGSQNRARAPPLNTSKRKTRRLDAWRSASASRAASSR